MEKERPTIVPEARHRGPNLGALAVVYTVLFVGSLVVTALLTGGHFPSPLEPPKAIQAFFTEHGEAVRIAALLQFGAAVPLGIFAATAVSRLQFLGVNVAGVFISLFGGLASSLFGAISGLLQWVLGQRGIASQPAATRVLHLLAFATGGVGFVVSFGLLIAGISVISWFIRLLPRWIAWSGLMLAALAELSSLSLIFMPVGYLLPVVRFGGLIWIIVAGFKLPQSRARVHARQLAQSA
jgi:hypothetical protein